MSLKVTITNPGSDTHLELSGILDETCTLPNFPDEIPGQLIIDLGHLTMINSLGCLRWLKWIIGVKARAGITLVHCSSAFITQVNLLKGFVPPGVTIATFLVPYLCGECAHEDHLLFTVGKDARAPQAAACTKCGGKSELDVVEVKYFHFLKDNLTKVS